MQHIYCVQSPLPSKVDYHSKSNHTVNKNKLKKNQNKKHEPVV